MLTWFRECGKTGCGHVLLIIRSSNLPRKTKTAAAAAHSETSLSFFLSLEKLCLIDLGEREIFFFFFLKLTTPLIPLLVLITYDGSRATSLESSHNLLLTYSTSVTFYSYSLFMALSLSYPKKKKNSTSTRPYMDSLCNTETTELLKTSVMQFLFCHKTWHFSITRDKTKIVNFNCLKTITWQ